MKLMLSNNSNFDDVIAKDKDNAVRFLSLIIMIIVIIQLTNR